jgi:hypothetical protein
VFVYIYGNGIPSKRNGTKDTENKTRTLGIQENAIRSSDSSRHFQGMIIIALSGLTGTGCLVFSDDIVKYARSLAEYDAKLRPVF